jgi:hypothetical protein
MNATAGILPSCDLPWLRFVDRYQRITVGIVVTRKLISSAAMRQVLGEISAMTEHRWRHDPELNFPVPIKIRGRNFWIEDEVLAWVEAQAGRPVSA